MILTKEQIAEIEKLAEPLVKFMCDTFHPHTQVVIESDGVHVYEGVAGVPITKHIKD